jgi:transcription initiation factor IIE alpha subunit
MSIEIKCEECGNRMDEAEIVCKECYDERKDQIRDLEKENKELEEELRGRY